ncbi:MAG TPA: class I tRNA ligase family protein, partial [Bacillota bacterium]|nr:class I tRNA ligase family protein [Bacillota bacterium]
DVLDTWFSSALWPFSTMGWPDKKAPDLNRYFPTDVLVTGYDIIPFWVARMIFQSKHFTGKRPFQDVLIHGMIRDAEGRKMSKSLGNGIDPMDVIEKYGADSLRYFLMTSSTPGQDLRFHWEKVESTWNFANKVWNASRFALMNLEGFKYEDIDLSREKSIADKWILTRLNETIHQVTAQSDRYDFGEAGRYLYNFIWHDFCDWYIEMAKRSLYGDDVAEKQVTKSVLAYVLDSTLRLLHPFMPFITEEIWQQIPHEGETITLAPWPTVHPEFQDDVAAGEMKRLVSIIKAVRNTRAEADTPLSKQIELLIQTKDEEMKSELEKNQDYLEHFCNPSQLIIETSVDIPDKSLSQIVTGAELFFPLEGLIDIEKEIERLSKQRETLQKEIDRVQNKLANEGFVRKAPKDIVDAEKQKEQDYKEKYRKVNERINELKQ